MSVESATLSQSEGGSVHADRSRVEEVLAQDAGRTIVLADDRERDELVPVGSYDVVDGDAFTHVCEAVHTRV